MQTQRRLEDAERRTMAIEMALASLSEQIGQIKDTLKNLGSGGLGPGSTGNGLFPWVTDGGGGGYYTGDGGWDWGDGTNYAPRGGLVDANSVWDQSTPMPNGAPCRLYVYVYDADTSAPIEGATVKVTISGGSTTRTTNASGYCSFDMTKGVSATIDVSASGYTSASKSVTINPGANGIHKEVINLTPSAPPGPGDPCTLDVLVKDNSGNPINDAPVKIIRAGVETVQNTDSSGHVSFSATQGESLTIDVYPSGYNSQTRSITVNAGSDGIDHETFNLDNAGAVTNIIISIKETSAGSALTCFRASGGGSHYDNNMTVTLSNGSTTSLTYPGDDGASVFACPAVHVGETITVRTASFIRKVAGAFVGGVFGYHVYHESAGSQSVGPLDASGAQTCQIVLPNPSETFEPY